MRYLYIIVIFLLSCSKEKTTTSIFKPIDSDQWYFKDFSVDSIPGIALDRVYNDIIKNKEGKSVIVAVIDSEINFNHDDLNGFQWINSKEIKGNGIDDDNNGYIDDVNGWNFLGGKNGNNIIYGNYTAVRIFRKYDSIFKGNYSLETEEDSLIHSMYQSAKKEIEKNKIDLKDELVFGDKLSKDYFDNLETVRMFFPKYDYDTIKLRTLFNRLELEKKSQIAKKVKAMIRNAEYGIDSTYVVNYNIETIGMLNMANNVDYYDRELINDDENNYSVHNGNNKLGANVKELRHGTYVGGVLFANRKNDKGIFGVTNNIEIMNIPVLPKTGAETDKDLAKAIRYAVDNGAKVINISLNRDKYLYDKWVDDALEYAEKSNVLIIKGVGNSGENYDEKIVFPDGEIKGKDLNNFLIVSSSNNKMKTRFKPSWAGYGPNKVDFFAPGNRIMTTDVENKYFKYEGNSLAVAMTSGVASLLLSYYPNLKASEIKEILSSSLDKYDIKVYPNKKKDSLVDFSSLSKHGGVLNAYKAFKLAESKYGKIK